MGTKFALVWDFILSLDLCPFGIPDCLASVLGHINDAMWEMGEGLSPSCYVGLLLSYKFI
jgi:hypothetical protein